MYRVPVFFGVVLLILVLGFFLIFGHHGKKFSPITNPFKSLPSYANTDAQVSMTIDGEVNGDDAHREIRVTVSRTHRDLDIIQGYSGHVISHYKFYNTQDAYTVFLNAINYSGFLLKDKGVPADLNSSGQCSLGNLFIYRLEENGNTLSNLWSSTCGSSTGNLAGNSGVLQSLFQAQITDYGTLTENVNLGD